MPKGPGRARKPLPNIVKAEGEEPIERVEHEYAPWEKRCHALANVLDIHKIISTEEKRRGVALRLEPLSAT